MTIFENYFRVRFTTTSKARELKWEEQRGILFQKIPKPQTTIFYYPSLVLEISINQAKS